MALLAGLFSGAAPPTFVEHEPWERGFAQIFARDVVPGLARLERRRRLLLLAILLIATAALLMTGLIIAKGLGHLATLPGIAALLACILMASRFKAREERLFLPAVCQQFDSVQVEVAPKGASLSAIDPYWNQGLIPRPEQRSRAVKLNVRELFTGERRGIGLSLVGIEVSRGSAIIGLNETLYLGDVVELVLPDPGPGRKYASWHSYATNLPGVGSATESRGLQTPQVTQALAELRKVFVPESIAVAVSENRLYLALPSSKQGRRIGRIGVLTPVYRCEPAIRFALAQLAAMLRLVDAVTEACATPVGATVAAPPAVALAVGPVAQTNPATGADAAAGAGPAIPSSRGRSPATPQRIAVLALIAVVLILGAATVALIFLSARMFEPHENTAEMARVREAADRGDATAQTLIGNAYWNGAGGVRDYAEAMRWYRMAADQGYAQAQNILGLFYLNGWGVAPDYAEAMRWFSKSADQGNAPAQNNLAVLYQNGRGMAQDYGEAMRWYRMAADQGYATAQNNIGVLYEAGWGVAQDYGEARRWYRMAADQGVATAQINVGNLYRNGSGVGRDYGEAMRWYRKAADQGDAQGQNNVGDLYWNGSGVARDDREALRWHRKAADQGYARAQRSVGWAYQGGTGVAQNIDEALQWYRKAAAQGDADAEADLGWLFWHGWGVARDYGEALRWYHLAADQGNATAQNNIGWLYQEGLGVTRDYGEAMSWYRKASDKGNASARNNIALLYQNGWGVGRDYGEAMNWYRKAADQRLARAQYHIGVLYANGWGVPTDPNEAQRWMRQAADGGEPDAKKWLAAQ